MENDPPMFGGDGNTVPDHKSQTAMSMTPISESQTLENLRLMQTNFLFLYGDHKSGKSAICSSLVYHIMTHPDVGQFTDRLQQPTTSQEFIQKAIAKISDKRFLPRTDLDTVTLAGGRFVPKNSRFASIPLTFMEMAGEELRLLVAPAGTAGFPKHIDVFLNDDSLNIVFILVIRHDTVSTNKDLMLRDFLEYVRSKNNKFENSRILLLISQWDNYKGDFGVDAFVEEYLPLTYAALSSSSNSIATYSVGHVTTVDSEPYIATLNPESPQKVLRWIYEAIAGKDFLRPSMWQRFIDLIR